jgi:lipopolysaccharide export system permease protein
MTAGGTLTRYISWRFLFAMLGVFTLCLVLIFFVDFIEVLRRSGKFGGAPAVMLVWLTLLRLPSVSEHVLPFAVLIGSIGGFLMLSRSSELVIARAAGMSAWQFILPGVLVAFAIGVLSTVFYNPLAAYAKARSENLYATLFNRETTILKTKGAGAWLRQEGVDGQSVIHADHAAKHGLSLSGVTALHFDKNGNMFERIEAESAELKDGRWELRNAWISTVGRQPSFHEHYILSTYLTPTQVRTALGSTASVSFWELPEFIDLADKAGLSATKYKLRYHMLLARPVLLAVMVLLAATCSLRAFRFGKIQTMVIAGLGAGFTFFIFSEMSRNLGVSGVAAPTIAAWAPVGVAGFLALTVLLYQEDG